MGGRRRDASGPPLAAHYDYLPNATFVRFAISPLGVTPLNGMGIPFAF